MIKGCCVMREVRIGLIGFGNVGREFVRQLLARERIIAERFRVRFSIVFIADSKGVLYGFPTIRRELLEKALKIPRGAVSSLKGGVQGESACNAVEELRPEVVIEVTPSVYDLNAPALENVDVALESGADVVLANKAPLALKYEYFMKKAASLGRKIFFKACVMAGTPLVDLIMYGLRGREIGSLVGILNGTTNYVLGLIEDGLNLREAVRRAIVEGYAEPNYATDLGGIDLAAKASILYSLSMKPISINDVVIENRIEEGVEEIIKDARSKRLKVKYVVVLTKNEAPKVKLVTLSEDDIMAQVRGVQNCVKIRTLDESEILLMGPGAGCRVTALTLLSDLLLSVHKV